MDENTLQELAKEFSDYIYFLNSAPGHVRSYFVLEAAHKAALAFPVPESKETFYVWSTREACVSAYVASLKAESPLRPEETLVLQVVTTLLLIEDKSGLFMGVARRMFPQYRFKWRNLRGKLSQVGRRGSEEKTE